MMDSVPHPDDSVLPNHDIRMICYSVWRQDDNGNRYLVETGLSLTEAQSRIAEFESQGHKQLYWSQRDEQSAA